MASLRISRISESEATDFRFMFSEDLAGGALLETLRRVNSRQR
jgi:hypothetical protein